MHFYNVRKTYVRKTYNSKEDVSYLLDCLDAFVIHAKAASNEIWAWAKGQKIITPNFGVVVIISGSIVKIIELNTLDYAQGRAGVYTENHHDKVQDVVFNCWYDTCEGDGSKIVPLFFVDFDQSDADITKKQVEALIVNKVIYPVMYLQSEPEPEPEPETGSASAANMATEIAKTLLDAPLFASLPEEELILTQEDWSVKDADAVKAERALVFGGKVFTPGYIVKEIASWDNINAINFNSLLFEHKNDGSKLIFHLFKGVGIIPTEQVTSENIATILSLLCSLAIKKEAYLQKIHNDDFYNKILQGLTPKPEPKPEPEPEPEPKAKLYISTSELAERLNIDVRGVRMFCNNNVFRYHKSPGKGTHTRFTEEEANYNMRIWQKIQEEAK